MLCSMLVSACSTGESSTSDVKVEKQSSLIDIYTVGDSDTVYREQRYRAGRPANRQLLLLALSDENIFRRAQTELGELFPST